MVPARKYLIYFIRVERRESRVQEFKEFKEFKGRFTVYCLPFIFRSFTARSYRFAQEVNAAPLLEVIGAFGSSEVIALSRSTIVESQRCAVYRLLFKLPKLSKPLSQIPL